METGVSINQAKNEIVIVGKPSETKEQFFAKVGKIVVIAENEDEYGKKGGQRPWATLSYDEISDNPSGGKEIKNLKIVINKSAFIIGEEDYTDLIQIAIHHELSELWFLAKTGYSLDRPNLPEWLSKKKRNSAHLLALREEYKLAFQKGKAERLLEFIKKSVTKSGYSSYKQTEIIHEHEEAYQVAKERFNRVKAN